MLDTPDRHSPLLRTILNIFCTLIECDVEQKISGAFIALENRLACQGASDITVRVNNVRTCSTQLPVALFLLARPG